jgi:hypothetical protein
MFEIIILAYAAVSSAVVAMLAYTIHNHHGTIAAFEQRIMALENILAKPQTKVIDASKMFL